MNPEEALKVCRIAKGAFPATSMDEYTPESWAIGLEDERFEDAMVALKAIMREQTFIHVSDIVKRVRRIRNERLLEFGPLPNPPSELADNPEGEMRWHADMLRRIADGEDVSKPPAIEPTPEHTKRLAELTRGALREVPGE